MPPVRYSLRLPEDLHAALERLAADNHRSLHGEMLDRLWGSVNGEVLWNPGGEVAALNKEDPPAETDSKLGTIRDAVLISKEITSAKISVADCTAKPPYLVTCSLCGAQGRDHAYLHKGKP